VKGRGERNSDESFERFERFEIFDWILKPVLSWLNSDDICQTVFEEI
jgi:hypothetical protein